jgi:hypothetical protein
MTLKSETPRLVRRVRGVSVVCARVLVRENNTLGLLSGQVPVSVRVLCVSCLGASHAFLASLAYRKINKLRAVNDRCWFESYRRHQI